MSRAANLRALGLAEASSPTKAELRKAYFHAAKKHHPDKGGSKEEFQKVQAAYESLQDSTAPESTAETAYDFSSPPSGKTRSYDHGESDEDDNFTGESYEFYEFWWSNIFASFGAGYSSNEDEQYERFSNAYKKTAKERREERKDNVKNRFDWRDTTATIPKKRKQNEVGQQCSFVGKDGKRCTQAGITQLDARDSGLNWDQYSQHPDVSAGVLATCWACKNAHETVMTQKQAEKKFCILKQQAESQATADRYNPVFSGLRKEGKSFEHTPNRSGAATRKNVYYWVKDLQDLATKKKAEIASNMSDVPVMVPQEAYLKVDFCEKEKAKRLGAKWNSDKRSWYVEAHNDLRPFSQWHPSVGNVAINLNG
jgi:curved DNA-binding protein CbpA